MGWFSTRLAKLKVNKEDSRQFTLACRASHQKKASPYSPSLIFRSVSSSSLNIFTSTPTRARRDANGATDNMAAPCMIMNTAQLPSTKPQSAKGPIAPPKAAATKKEKSPQKPRHAASSDHVRAALFMKDRRAKKRASMGFLNRSRSSTKSSSVPEGFVKADGRLNIPTPPPGTPDQTDQIEEQRQAYVETQSIDTFQTHESHQPPTSDSRQVRGEEKPIPPPMMKELNPREPEPEPEHERTTSLSSPETTLVEPDATTNDPPATGTNIGGISFVLHGIDSLIKESPELKDGLMLVRKAALRYDTEIQKEKRALESGINEKLWESFRTIQELENELKEKEKIHENYQKHLYNYEDAISKVNKISQEERDRNAMLVQSLNAKTEYIRLARKEHGNAIIGLTRENTQLREHVEHLQDMLDTEKLKSDAEMAAKENALKYNETLRTHFTFYRDYFDKQENIYKTYFGKHVSPDGKKALTQVSTVGKLTEEIAHEGSISTSASQEILDQGASQGKALGEKQDLFIFES
jgi:hypothetical protein